MLQLCFFVAYVIVGRISGQEITVPIGTCSEPKDMGTTCRDSRTSSGLGAPVRLRRWYYNEKLQLCISFAYNGCGGNGNRFNSKDDCEFACKPGDGFSCAAGNEAKGLCGVNKPCPAGFKCVNAAFIRVCCNQKDEEDYEKALNPTCPSGEPYKISRNFPVMQPLLADSCSEMDCPEEYTCQAGKPWSYCCLTEQFNPSPDSSVSTRIPNERTQRPKWTRGPGRVSTAPPSPPSRGLVRPSQRPAVNGQSVVAGGSASWTPWSSGGGSKPSPVAPSTNWSPWSNHKSTPEPSSTSAPGWTPFPMGEVTPTPWWKRARNTRPTPNGHRTSSAPTKFPTQPTPRTVQPAGKPIWRPVPSTRGSITAADNSKKQAKRVILHTSPQIAGSKPVDRRCTSGFPASLIYRPTAFAPMPYYYFDPRYLTCHRFLENHFYPRSNYFTSLNECISACRRVVPYVAH